jgi:hypothetical protein
MQAVANVRTAWRLFRSDDSAETVVALVLVAVTLGPPMWKMRQGGDE